MKRTIKKMLVVFLALLTVFLFSACKKENKVTDNTESGKDAITGDYLVVLDLSEMTTTMIPYEIKSNGIDDSLTELIEALTGYQDEVYSSPIYDNVKIIDGVYADGIVSVYFESSYYDLVIADEVLMRSAIVETLCQLDEVEEVSFFIDDAPLTIQGAVVGRMNSNSFLHEMGNVKDTTRVTLYFPDRDMNGLIKIVREASVDARYTDEQLIIEELLKGPVNGEAGVSSMPEGTSLLNVVTKDMVCYVNFSTEFLNNVDDVSDTLVIYSLVNTLCEVSNVRSVVISVEGEKLEYYKTVNCSEMLTYNYDLVIDNN